MKIKRSLLFLAVMGTLAVSASAARKSFDLYSWPEEGTVNYCYAILPSSKDALPAAEIQTAKIQVCGGAGDLKRIMGQNMPEGSKLTWKTDSANGLTLPDQGIVNDISGFVKTIPYTLVVEKPK